MVGDIAYIVGWCFIVGYSLVSAVRLTCGIVLHIARKWL